MIAQETLVLSRSSYVDDVVRTLNLADNVQFLESSTKVSFANVGPGYPAPNRSDDYTITATSGNFWDIISDQVHIFPSLDVDFGLVLSQKEMLYYVWNSWSTKSVEVFAPVTTGDLGTTLVWDIAGDFTLGPGQGTPGKLTVFIDGPISSSTSFYIKTILDGTAQKDYTVNTRATRVIAAPFWADWAKKVEFGVDFSTVLLERKNFTEQRRPMVNKPRRTVSFTNNAYLRNMVSNFINFAGDRTIGVPIIHEMFQVQYFDADKKGVEIREMTTELWNLNKYCDYIILYDIEKRMVVAKKIASKSLNHIYFENPVLETLSIESKIVGFPMIIGYINAAKADIVTSNLVDWTVDLYELVGENQPDLLSIPALPTDFPFDIDWSDSPSFERSFHRNIEEFAGITQVMYSKFPFNKQTASIFIGKITLNSRQEFCSFMDFISAAKGRLNKFNITVPINTVNVIRGEYAGSSSLWIKNNFLAEQFSKMANKDVVIKYHNNTLTTKLNSVENNGEFTTVNFLNSIPWRIYDEDCQDVQIFKKIPARLDMDNFRFSCENGKFFTITIRVKEM